MRFFSRIFGAKAKDVPRLIDLARRMDELEDEVEHWKQLHRKLAGQVRGGMRRGGETQQDAPETSNGDAPPQPSASREIENGRLLVALRRGRGLLPG